MLHRIKALGRLSQMGLRRGDKNKSDVFHLGGSGFEPLESRVLLSSVLVDPVPISDPGVLYEGFETATIVESGDGASELAPLTDTFKLHSNPSANHTIYLDFDGHVTENTSWNSYKNISSIVTPAFDTDGDSSFFSDSELIRIQNIFDRVVEDFLPFDVDVTTEAPSADDLIKSGSSDTNWGVRVLIGGSSSDWYGSSAGGVAYLNSFNWGSDTPTFVFEAQLGNGHEKYTAEAISHEVGHTLGLNHDGNSSTGYYTGHGSGETGWAPILGVGYYQNLVQWSKGEYADASNTQDDLSIITSNNGFDYRTDDHGSTDSSATNITVIGDAINTGGIIERNTDVDWFSFTTAGGSISLDISPATRGPNLDILAELYDDSFNLISASNPLDLLGAEIDAVVGSGTYYLSITGTGKGDVSGTGYSDYGSLGEYTIAGSVASAGATLFVSDATVNESDGAAAFDVQLSEASTEAVTVNLSAVNGTAVNGSDFSGGSYSVTFDPGQTSKSISVTILDDGVSETDEQFTVEVTSVTGSVIIGDGQGQATIFDDDLPAPEISVGDVTVNEADGTAVFDVVLSGPSDEAVTVDLSVVNGTAVNGSDFSGGSYSVTFDPGQTSKSVAVTIINDDATESSEQFTLEVTGVTGDAIVSDGQGQATIFDDDLPAPTITISDATVNEGNPKKGKNAGVRITQVSFTVSLSHASDDVVTVDYSTSDVTATSGEDYTSVSGTVTFNPGETNKTITVEVMGDDIVESDETFNVNLASSINATLATGASYIGVGTIVNDDSSGGGGGGGGGRGKPKKSSVFDSERLETILLSNGMTENSGSTTRFESSSVLAAILDDDHDHDHDEPDALPVPDLTLLSD